MESENVEKKIYDIDTTLKELHEVTEFCSKNIVDRFSEYWMADHFNLAWMDDQINIIGYLINLI